MASKGLKCNQSLEVRANKEFLDNSEKAFAYVMKYRSQFTFRKSTEARDEF